MARITVLIFVGALLFCLCSCGGKEQAETTVTEVTGKEETTAFPVERTITLGYYSQYSLHPYDTTSKINKGLLTLVYDGLFKVDNTFSPVPAVAEEYALDGKKLTVKIKDDILFSNGDALTAADVVYSFNLAKKSELYSGRLAQIESAENSGDRIIFILTEENIYAVSCLDFPIISREENSLGLPFGSGRYTLEKKDDTFCLRVNKRYSLEEKMENETIELLDLNKTLNVLNLLQIGQLSFFFDDMNDTQTQEKINANTIQVSLNSLCFLGINNSSEYMADKNIKNAVCLALNKHEIVGSVYEGLAKECEYPFNPDWIVAEPLYKDISSKEKESEPDLVAAQQLLEKSGYVYAYKNNEFRSKNYEFLKLRLVVSNADERKKSIAEIIGKQLKSIGINAEINEVNADEFEKCLQNGNFDLYVGETKLPPSMDLSVFFSENGTANFSIDAKSTTADAYHDFIKGKIDIVTFAKVFDEYKPFVPLCFRYGIAYFSNELKFEGSISESDIYANIYSFSF